jgi:mRNA-degrading endonuclease toxin of MazEF toxin-antitoxin module
VKDYPVLVEFKNHESSLEHGGAVDLSRIMTIPKTMLRDRKGRLSSLKMSQVTKAILVSLGIE